MSENPNDPFAPSDSATDPFAGPAVPVPRQEAGTGDLFDVASIDSSGVPAFDLPAASPARQQPARQQPAATPVSVKPRCATHPDRFARSVACERCGNYACEACFSVDNERFCASCAARVGMVVPWESQSDEGVFRRMLNTCTHLAQAPFERFGQIGEGDLGRALSFTGSISLAAYGATIALCGPILLLGFGMLAINEPSDDPSALWLFPIFIVMALFLPFIAAASQMLSALFWGSVYHLGAKLAGGQASYNSSLRVAQYQSVLIPLDVLVSFVSNVPLIGPMVSLGWLAAKNLLSIFAYAGHARTQHRLEGATSWIVAATPTLLALAFFGVLMVLAVAFVFATIGDSPFLDDLD